MTMKRIFYSNSVQTVLRSMAILTAIFLGSMSTNAQESDDEYIPFVEEGKVWTCKDDWGIYGTPIGYDVFFTMSGDTEINGKTYKKVFLQFPDYFGDEEQHYYCAVREEGCRVFLVEPEAEEEKLLYDFSRPEEIIELSYDHETLVRNAGYKDEYCRPHQMYYELYTNAAHINNGYVCYDDWREGVGSIHSNPFACEVSPKGSSRIPSRILVQECTNSAGEYLWNVTWTIRPNSIQETLKETPAGSTLYDLQGRRLTTQPTKGVYIQNGKLYVVK